MKMSTKILVIMTMLTSSILCFFTNSWVVIWILLEINTLSFCSLNTNLNKDKELMMKYLVIQSITSAVLITMMILTNSMDVMKMNSAMILGWLGLTAIIIKTGGSPFHQWFIEISKKMSWLNVFTLFTWQKLAPCYLLIFQMKKSIIPFIFMSAILAPPLMLNKTSLKEILAFSSVFNLSWIFTAILMSTKNLIQFSMLYWISLMFPLLVLKKEKMKKMEEVKKMSMNKNVMLMMMASLAGLPPLLGFMAKWMTLSNLISYKMLLMATMILLMSAINLFIYLRIVNPISMNYSSQMKESKQMKSITNKSIFIITNMLSLTLFLF